MKIKPFRALSPAHGRADLVASVPYDTVSRAEAAKLAEGNRFSFLRVTRPEIDFPEDTDPHDERVYGKALSNFQRLRTENVLIEDREPCLYLYRMITDAQPVSCPATPRRRPAHVQIGIMACCHADDYAANIVRKHENTRHDKETDRARLTSTLNAHTGPVLLTYRDIPEIEGAIREMTDKQAPLYELGGADGVLHTVWRIANAHDLVDALRRIPVAYIADGHHRAAAALRVARERGDNDEAQWFPAILFQASGLRVLPYNRCVRDLRGLSEAAFLDAVRSRFAVTPHAPDSPAEAGHISMYLAGQWYDLDCGVIEGGGDPVKALDVSILQERLLDPILGIRDPRSDERIEHISGDRCAAELKNPVDAGQAAVAFSMFPVATEQLMAIADAGAIMPPKSTWFSPKPMSGLVIHAF